MKMSAVCRMAVVLAFILSTEHSCASADQFSAIVERIMDRYTINNQFSLAINIPADLDQNKLDKVFEENPSDEVKKMMLAEEVYISKNMVAAKYKPFNTYTEHAEKRVLDNLKPLADKSEGNFLIFYSYYSPCAKKCAEAEHPNNILKQINEFIPSWNNKFAFVFTEVYDWKRHATVALEQLRTSQLADNIFRCYYPDGFKCFKCIGEDKKIIKQCVVNNS